MSQMIVRPPSLWINPFGNLADEYSVYVGKPSQDPTQTSSQLTVRDGKGEDASIVMQPIIVTDGVTRNSSGQKILPVIDSQNYSLLYVSANGSKIYSESSFFGDGLSSTGEGGAIAEVAFNNLQQALATDLTEFNYIFIKSEAIGWEGTETGPTINALYFYTGATGSPSTGDDLTFYDSAGNEWEICASKVEQANTDLIADNTLAIADNATEIARVDTDLSVDIAAVASTANSANATAASANATANAANATANAAQSTANSKVGGSASAVYAGTVDVSNAAGSVLPPGFSFTDISGGFYLTHNLGINERGLSLQLTTFTESSGTSSAIRRISASKDSGSNANRIKLNFEDTTPFDFAFTLTVIN